MPVFRFFFFFLASVVLLFVLATSSLALSLTGYDPRDDMGLPHASSNQIRQAMEYGDVLLAKAKPVDQASMAGKPIPVEYVAVEQETSKVNDMDYWSTYWPGYFYRRHHFGFGHGFESHFAHPRIFHRFGSGFAGNFNRFNFQVLR